MPVLVDDVTHPADNDATNDPASAGAAELRALKAKLNNIFLNTGVDLDSDKLVTLNGRGLYAVYTASNSGAGANKIFYGFASNVNRSGGTAHTVGGQFSAYLADNSITVDPGQVFGVVSQAVSAPTSHGALVAAEFAVGGLQSNNSRAIIGCNIVFKNRTDGAADPTSGLGSNKYNTGSIALWFTSQTRGTSGAYCGWNKGIVFDEYSMDLANGVRGCAIDTYSLHYDGGVDPRTAYRVDAVIRMRNQQSIMWDDGAGNKTRIYVDSGVGRLVIAEETVGVGYVERWGVKLSDGSVYKNGVLQY